MPITKNKSSAEGEAIKLHSNEVQEIISTNPAWIIRNGISVFFVIIACLVVCTFFISYPDVIKAPVHITGINTPKLLIAKADGKLLNVFVENEVMVDSNQILAIINNTTRYSEYRVLEKWVQKIEEPALADNLEVVQTIHCPLLTDLGELQQPYQDFRNTLSQTLQVLGNGFYQQKKNALQRELALIDTLKQSIDRQQKLVENDYSLQQVEYQANETLATDRVIAPIELNREKAKLLIKQQSIEQMTTNIINNASISQSKKKEILDLQKTIADIRQSFQTSLFGLKSKLTAWKEKYVIVAAEKGKLQFVAYLQPNQLIKTGQEMFYTVPNQPLYLADVIAPQYNYGKIKKNQPVIIRLSSYPYNEFGTIKGIVSYIPNVPFKDTAFLLSVTLPNGLTTSYQKKLPFKNNMSGEAEIIRVC